MTLLPIGDVARRAGIPAGTLRMWERRYGFPCPERAASGRRRYPAEAVDALRRVAELRAAGRSLPAAIEEARRLAAGSDRPSLYAAVAGDQRPRLLRKATLVALSRAIEDEAMRHAAAPVVVGAFQREAFYRPVEPRYRALARLADAVAVFADFPAAGRRGGVAALPIAPGDALRNEWAVVVDAPGYAACLLAWEPARGAARDAERRFEAVLTMDPEVTRRAALCAARLAGRRAPAEGARLEALLAGRPLALERPAPALAALADRIVAYLDEDDD